MPGILKVKHRVSKIELDRMSVRLKEPFCGYTFDVYCFIIERERYIHVCRSVRATVTKELWVIKGKNRVTISEFNFRKRKGGCALSKSKGKVKISKFNVRKRWGGGRVLTKSGYSVMISKFNLRKRLGGGGRAVLPSQKVESKSPSSISERDRGVVF